MPIVSRKKKNFITTPHNSTLDDYFVVLRGRKGRDGPRRYRSANSKTTGLDTKRLDISTSGWILGDKLAVLGCKEPRKDRRLSHDRLEGARKMTRYMYLCVRAFVCAFVPLSLSVCAHARALGD